MRGTEDELGDRHLEAPRQDRARHARLRLHEHRLVRVGDHLHRRRGGHPALPRHPDRAARVEGHSPSFLETSYLLIYGELPTTDAARRLPLRRSASTRSCTRTSSASSTASRRTRTRWAMLSSVVSALSTFYQDSDRPARSRAGAALDRAADGEAADDRGVRVQEVDRPAVPLPEQLARPHRELPHDDVRGAVGAVRGQPDRRARAEAAADPARRPRAELLDVDRAPRRLERGEPLRVGRRRHQRAVGPAARRREPGRHRDARERSATTAATSTSTCEKAKDPDDPFRLSGFGHRVYKNYDPRARILKEHRRPGARRARPGATSCSTSRCELEEVALNDEYFVERKLYPNVDFYSGLIYRAMGFPTKMFTGAVRDGPPARLDRALEGDDGGPEDEDRPSPPDLHRPDRAPVRSGRAARLTVRSSHARGSHADRRRGGACATRCATGCAPTCRGSTARACRRASTTSPTRSRSGASGRRKLADGPLGRRRRGPRSTAAAAPGRSSTTS